MEHLWDEVARRCGRSITRTYSTSFSLGIRFLDRQLRDPVYGLYGFVRLADEIVDTFHRQDKARLLARLRADTFAAIDQGFSVNPVLHGFQRTVNDYGIGRELIETFLHSMEMDLTQKAHDAASFEEYVLGSAEVVGLMCLRVFCEGDERLYASLEGPALRLGAAFQKVNFLRDIHFDLHTLQRAYFPGWEAGRFTPERKRAIEANIRADFSAALEGIRRLPSRARLGVYVAYVYYLFLLKKIERCTPEALTARRVRLPNLQKGLLFIYALCRYKARLW